MWIPSRQAGGPGQGLGPGLHFVGDLHSPLGAVGRNLERDQCPLHATNLPAFGKHRAILRGESSDAASDDKGKRLGLALVGALVDEETGRALGLPRPKITFPSADPDEAETVEIDIAVPAALDVPEEDRLAEAVVWRLGEGAGGTRQRSCSCRTTRR